MKLIKTENTNKIITSHYTWDFNVPIDGLYAVEVIASCKSWWQNTKSLKSLLNDDDLEIKLNGRAFKMGNDAVSWNGNVLKGLAKTVVLATKLRKGNHSLLLLPDKQPFVESITVYQSDNESSITYVPEHNNPPQDGDRRPWMTFVLVDAAVKQIKIKASAKKYPKSKDDNDIKLLINGKVERNESKDSHRDWYWCGKVLQGVSKEFNRDLNLSSGLHTIELYVDKTPKVEEISLNIEVTKPRLLGKIALHQDIEVTDSVALRSSAEHIDNSTVLARLKHGEIVEILELIIHGKKVQNRSEIWHRVKYKELIGYVASPFVEINGQERKQIILKIQEQAKEKGIDQDYALALAGCESFYKPYATSGTGALGIFQLTGSARKHLRDSLGFHISEDEPDNFDADTNIAAGLTYLQWIFKKYRDSQDMYRKVTAAWNAGASLIPAEGPVTLQYITGTLKRKEAQNLVERVEKNRQKKDWGNIIINIILLFCILIGGYALHSVQYPDDIAAKPQVLGAQEVKKDIDFRFSLDGRGLDIQIADGFYKESGFWFTDVDFTFASGKTFHKRYHGGLYNAFIFDWGLEQPKLVIILGEAQSIWTSMLSLEEGGRDPTPVLFVHKDRPVSYELCCKFAIFKPQDNGVHYDLAMIGLESEPWEVYKYRYADRVYVEQ